MVDRISSEGVDETIAKTTDAITAELTNPVVDDLLIIRDSVAGEDKRVALANLTKGLGYTPSGTGAVATTVERQLNLLETRPENFGAVGDGVTDDTLALNAAATEARASTKTLVLDAKTYLVSGSVDFSGLTVRGYGENSLIQATSAQFDVVITSGNSTFEKFQIHGGWDGVTAGQTGNGIAVQATAPDYPYSVHMHDLRVQFCKENGIFMERSGYSSLNAVKCNASGLHGLFIFGNNGADSATTVTVGETCVFSDCPNGYGIKINNGINIAVYGAICEFSKGIELSGNDNRNISFFAVYQENTTPANFITFGSSSGIGLCVVGCFGGSIDLPYTANWSNVLIDGNVGFSENGMYGNGRLLQADGGENTTVVAGDFTASSLSIPVGTWLIEGLVQTEDAGSGALDILATRLTTTNTDTANETRTNANFVYDIDRVEGTRIKARSRITRVYQNSTGVAQIMYLRTYINRTAGTVAFRGFIKATKLA